MKTKHLIIFGTRPEAIKMAPLVKEFQKHTEFETKVCVTAQHREMLDQVLDFFEIKPDYDLNLMKPNQNLYTLTADIITDLKPILDDFKPDLIINSAGQDNHYSDPLTNMNFTAKGYAILNDRLNPDIAVLEGGYSIETALPYINLGIILAMAGLDYSQVMEPDYNAEALKQDQQITKYIRDLSKVVYDRWKNKEALAKKAFTNKSKVVRSRQIYYDTSGIMESQSQTYNICDKCPGVDEIDSKSDKGDHILGITIPRRACKSCQEKALDLYHNSSLKKYTNIYLQDKAKDQYFSK